MKTCNRRTLLFAAFAFVATGCGQSNTRSATQEIVIDMDTVRSDLLTLAESRILLGHQSVGRDILSGLRSLATDTGTPLRIIEVNGAPPDDLPGIFHSNIGKNGDPGSKCEAFDQLLTAFGQPSYDLAAMKFCYVDLGRSTSTELSSMLGRYERLVDKIKRERPDVELLHITMPLQSDMPGKKTRLKRLLGISMPNDADNILRNAFNASLRERYSSESLFDLAAVESTLPDGTRSSFSKNGSPIYTLAAEYTNDGGHLVGPAQRLAAMKFANVVAETLRNKHANDVATNY